MVDLTKKRAFEDICPDCRDGREPTDTASYCVCPPKLKAQKYINNVMNRIRNKIAADEAAGVLKDDKKYLSLMEDTYKD